MAKLNPLLVRNVMWSTLVAAAFGCVIGVNLPTRKPSQGQITAKDATIQPSPLESVRQEIASNSEGNASQKQRLVNTGKGIFPINPKQTASERVPLFPNLPPDKNPPPAQAFRKLQRDNLSSISSSNTKSGETLPAFLPPDNPQNNTTPPGKGASKFCKNTSGSILLPCFPSGLSGRTTNLQKRDVPPEQGLQGPPRNGVSQNRPSGEQPATTFWVPPEFQAKIVKKIIPVAQQKVIALTFDDGPWPANTLKILDTLKKNNIKATFFWVGQALKDNPQIGKQVVAQGHVIGNHTWHHWYRKLDPSTAAHEIDDTAELIYKTTGVRTSLFRPPGGVMNNGVADYAIQKKNVIVMWSNDPMDYRPHSANQLVNYVMRKAQPGAIVLMHDGGGNHSATVQALPQIIAKLTKQGYEFVTIPELLELRDPKSSTVIAKKDLPSGHRIKP